MRLKVIGACMAAMSICLPVAQAQTATIGEAIQVMGDLSALEVICPALNGDKETAYAYLQTNGFTEKMVGGGGVYIADVELAKKDRLAARKAMSVSDNCKDALNLYGENGTVVKGVLAPKAPGAGTK